ncbi:MAG: hypothetical protein V7631_3350 [Massilia sp.]|jgi:hypothetical protein
MDYTKLLFAAEVHRLAAELRASDWTEYVRKPNKDDLIKHAQPGSAVYVQSCEKWHAENPLSEYITKAFALIRDTALQIKTLE